MMSKGHIPHFANSCSTLRLLLRNHYARFETIEGILQKLGGVVDSILTEDPKGMEQLFAISKNRITQLDVEMMEEETKDEKMNKAMISKLEKVIQLLVECQSMATGDALKIADYTKTFGKAFSALSDLRDTFGLHVFLVYKHATEVMNAKSNSKQVESSALNQKIKFEALQRIELALQKFADEVSKTFTNKEYSLVINSEGSLKTMMTAELHKPFELARSSLMEQILKEVMREGIGAKDPDTDVMSAEEQLKEGADSIRALLQQEPALKAKDELHHAVQTNVYRIFDAQADDDIRKSIFNSVKRPWKLAIENNANIINGLVQSLVKKISEKPKVAANFADSASSAAPTPKANKVKVAQIDPLATAQETIELLDALLALNMNLTDYQQRQYKEAKELLAKKK